MPTFDLWSDKTQQWQNATATKHNCDKTQKWQNAKTTKYNSDKMQQWKMYCLIYWGSHKLTKRNCDKMQRRQYAVALCPICILSGYPSEWHLCFILSVFCHCILSPLYFVTFALCYFCILSQFHSVTFSFSWFVFCRICIL